MCVRGISLPYSPNNCVCMHVFLPLTEMNAAVTSDETPMGWSDACKGVELPPLTCSGATRLRGGDQLTTLNIFLRAQGDCLACSSFSFYPHTHQASGLASRGGWAEPRPRTFGSWRLASPLAFPWVSVCFCFYITTRITSSLVLCWRALLKPLTSLFNKRCLNAASTLKRLVLLDVLAPLRISS